MDSQGDLEGSVWRCTGRRVEDGWTSFWWACACDAIGLESTLLRLRYSSRRSCWCCLFFQIKYPKSQALLRVSKCITSTLSAAAHFRPGRPRTKAVSAWRSSRWSVASHPGAGRQPSFERVVSSRPRVESVEGSTNRRRPREVCDDEGHGASRVGWHGARCLPFLLVAIPPHLLFLAYAFVCSPAIVHRDTVAFSSVTSPFDDPCSETTHPGEEEGEG